MTGCLAKKNPDDAEEGKDYKDYLNPGSLKVCKGYLEPSVKNSLPGDKFQFERLGYFTVDKDSTTDHLVFQSYRNIERLMDKD